MFSREHLPPPRVTGHPVHWGLCSSMILALVVATACESSPSATESTVGAIEITTLTEGTALVPDSFEVLVNGARSGTTGPNDVYYMETLPRGVYQVGLREDPEECRFSANPREVLVTPKDTAHVTFLVWCK